MRRFELKPRVFLFLVVIFAASGCAPLIHWAGIQLYYRPAEFHFGTVMKDVSYWMPRATDPDPKRHSLNLFLPRGKDWPVLIFVHGGGWTKGEKDLTVAGADIYGNLGRFYAERGIGVAVINYRLIPNVAWPEQIRDVAMATSWIMRHIGDYGGNPQRVFLAGHSAGAQLATRVALDPQALRPYRLTSKDLCGVVAVSGAGYDMTDELSYELAGGEKYYEKRFGANDPTGDWKTLASPLSFASKKAPPFLIIHAARESKALRRQSALLHHKLLEVGAQSRLVTVPIGNHERMALTLSRDDQVSGAEVLEFVHRTKCGQ